MAGVTLPALRGGLICTRALGKLEAPSPYGSWAVEGGGREKGSLPLLVLAEEGGWI